VSLSERVARRLGLGELARALAAGGIEVLTPEPGSEADEVWFRTLIELDGDVVTSVLRSRLSDRDNLEAHFLEVDRRVTEIAAGARRLRLALAAGIGAPVTLAATWAAAVDGVSILEGVSVVGTGAVTGMVAVRVHTVRRYLLGLLFGPGIRRILAQSASQRPSGESDAQPFGGPTRLF
jgi:hypothetical protein